MTTQLSTYVRRKQNDNPPKIQDRDKMYHKMPKKIFPNREGVVEIITSRCQLKLAHRDRSRKKSYLTQTSTPHATPQRKLPSPQIREQTVEKRNSCICGRTRRKLPPRCTLNRTSDNRGVLNFLPCHPHAHTPIIKLRPQQEQIRRDTSPHPNTPTASCMRHGKCQSAKNKTRIPFDTSPAYSSSNKNIFSRT